MVDTRLLYSERYKILFESYSLVLFDYIVPFQTGQGWNTVKGTSKGTVRNETNRNGMKIKSEGSSSDTAFDLRPSKKNRIKLHIERIILLNEFIGLQTISFAESPSIVKSPERSSQNRRSYSLADSY